MRSDHRLAWCAFFVLAGGTVAGLAADAKQVLVLYPTRSNSQIAVIGDRELPRILEAGLPEGLSYYSEFIDQGRFVAAEYIEGFRDFLRLKYADHQFDVVIAMGRTSFEFVEKYHTELFPQTPVVFFSDRNSPRRIANSTGVIDELNLSSTIALATELQPDARHVFVVNGTDDFNRTFEEVARAQFRPFEPRLTITYLSGLATADLETQLAKLPEHSIVYYMALNRSPDRPIPDSLAYLEVLAAIANRPMYSWVDSTIGRGIVGGSVRSQRAQVEVVGNLALRVLHGERAESMPVSRSDLTVRQVDWRQLRRWHISEARVPPGTTILFRQTSAFEQYRNYILGAISVVILQTLLIGGLVIQRRRRRLAEQSLRTNEAKLRASNAQTQDLASRLISAQEAERARIARELHDDIGQQVALLALDLDTMGSAAPGQVGQIADQALSRTQRLAGSVHDLSHRLHPTKLQLIGLVPALQAFHRELSQSGMAVAFTYENIPATLPADVTVCLFRIAQEALQNARNYSRGRKVSVDLRGGPERITLTIVDDGIGFDVEAAWGKGLGLVSMSERVAAIGGRLQIRSTPGEGTCLEAVVLLRVERSTESAAEAS